MKVNDIWSIVSTDNDLEVVDIETGEVYAYTDAVDGNRDLCMCYPEYTSKVMGAEVVKLEINGWHRATLTAWVRLYTVIYG